MADIFVAAVLSYAKANGSEAIIDAFLPNAKKQRGYLKLGNVMGDAGDSLFGKLDGYRFKDGATGESVDIITLVQKANTFTTREEAAEAIVKRLNLSTNPLMGKNLTGQDQTPSEVCVVPPSEVFDRDMSQFVVGFSDKKGQTLIAVHVYHTDNGDPFFIKLRKEAKTQSGKTKKYFVQAGWFGDDPVLKFQGSGRKFMPPYQAHQIKAEPDKPILFVEGEKTADAAQERFPDHVVTTLFGGSGGVDQVDLTLFCDRDVTIWPDNDPPGLKMADKLAIRLTQGGARTVKLVDPSKLSSKWDLADEIPDGVDVQAMLEIAKDFKVELGNLLELPIEMIAKRLVYVGQIQIFADSETGRRYELPDLNNLLKHISGSPKEELLKNPILKKAPGGVAFLPKGDRPIAQDVDGVDVYNSWLPTSIKPRKGNAFPFVRMIRRLCETRDEFTFLKNWCAHLIQYPDRKMRVALMLVGKQGTGKNTLAYIVRDLIGPTNFATVTTTQLKGQFNSFMDSKLLIAVDEVMAFGRLELANTLKDLISEPMVTINGKHKQEYTIQNFANFLLLSNYSNAMVLTEDDRRHFVINCQRNRPSSAYFTALHKWISGNKDVVLDYLLNVDLSGFDPNQPAEMTRGKQIMIEKSRDPVEEEIENLILNREKPFDKNLFELKAALGVLVNPLNGHSVGQVTQKQLVTILGKLGAVRLKQKGITWNGSNYRKSLWVCRDVEKYQSMTDRDIMIEYINENEPGGFGDDEPF